MRDIRQILCPIDLSDISRHALDHARVLAAWYGAKITALHICNPMVIPSADFAVGGAMPPPVLTDAERQEARQQVLEFIGAEQATDMNVRIGSGRATNGILDVASALPADLVVIGTHGFGGFEHLVLGSVTEKILRRASCPVLTVPPLARTTSKLPFKRLLCPVDFSESSLAALELAVSLAQEGDADLTILHVFEQSPDEEPRANRPIVAPEYIREMEAGFTARLDALVPRNIGDVCRPHARTAHGKPYREILGIATEASADLIVMGVHGCNAIDLMLFGSTTNQVVRRATCPVLTLRR
jgi:nucleotide-binding universal stress UspA family protein